MTSDTEAQRSCASVPIRYDPAVRAIFGDFVLDVGRRQLFRGDTPIHLSGKALQLLELILRTAPEALSKESAYRHLWGEAYVEETNVAKLVSEIRDALGEDSRRPALIRTLHRFGYRCDVGVAWQEEERTATPVAAPNARAWLVSSFGTFFLKPGENVVGRDPAADVPIASPSISRRHARLELGDEIFLEDLGSKNGTFVRGERITAPVMIHDGDEIGFGSVAVVFRMMANGGSTITDLRP